MKHLYKYDMHCHVKEGSDDSAVTGEEYIKALVNNGFHGFAITDHNSFSGFEYIENNLKDKYPNLCILKGIEYDSLDAGHVLVFMKDGFDGNYLTKRGSKLIDVIEYVHKNGGILGPAHPFSEPYLAIFNSIKYKEEDSIYQYFDFVEVLNGGEKKEENTKAKEYAKKHDLVMFGGSDSHHIERCGATYTEFEEIIHTNNELIDYVKKHKNTIVGGSEYLNIDRDKYDRFGKLLYSFHHLENIYYSVLNKLK